MLLIYNRAMKRRLIIYPSIALGLFLTIAVLNAQWQPAPEYSSGFKAQAVAAFNSIERCDRVGESAHSICMLEAEKAMDALRARTPGDRNAEWILSRYWIANRNVELNRNAKNIIAYRQAYRAVLDNGLF